jgi:hypothetical protein
MSKIAWIGSGITTGILLSFAITGLVEETYEKRINELRRIRAYYDKDYTGVIKKNKTDEDIIFRFLYYTYYDYVISGVINTLKFIGKKND